MTRGRKQAETSCGWRVVFDVFAVIFLVALSVAPFLSTPEHVPRGELQPSAAFQSKLPIGAVMPGDRLGKRKKPLKKQRVLHVEYSLFSHSLRD